MYQSENNEIYKNSFLKKIIFLTSLLRKSSTCNFDLTKASNGAKVLILLLARFNPSIPLEIAGVVLIVVQRTSKAALLPKFTIMSSNSKDKI